MSKITNFNGLVYNDFILYLFKYFLDNSCINFDYTFDKFIRNAVNKVNINLYLYLSLCYRDFILKLIERRR